MCCSRMHYPKEIGITDSDGRPLQEDETHGHYHLTMPWNSMSCVCIMSGDDWLKAQWSNFAHIKLEHAFEHHSGVYMNLQASEGQRTAKLLAMGVAEGGYCSAKWVEQTASEYLGREIIVTSEGDWVLEPPPALEYHEWLMQQAQRELREKQGVR